VEKPEETRTDEQARETKETRDDQTRKQRAKRTSLEHIRKATRIKRRIEQEMQDPDTLGTESDTPIWLATDTTGEAYKQSGRSKDPFAPNRIREITEKISIGPDVDNTQREAILNLIKEFADIFALSLSEVFPVNFTTHKLHVDPTAMLPKKIHQKQHVTAAQKEWYDNILTDMERADVIQKVPAEFIKCLSSTNLAPKEAGKTGMTRETVLQKCNEQCRKYGLGPFWEEIARDEKPNP
jgi:hypothetical protein